MDAFAIPRNTKMKPRRTKSCKTVISVSVKDLSFIFPLNYTMVMLIHENKNVLFKKKIWLYVMDVSRAHDLLQCPSIWNRHSQLCYNLRDIYPFSQSRLSTSPRLKWKVWAFLTDNIFKYVIAFVFSQEYTSNVFI